MTFLEAKQEFQIRLYSWAKSEWEKEISDSFPSLQMFKSGSPWRTFQFLRQLDRCEQITLAHGLLKRNFPDVVQTLGESLLMEEESLCSRRDDFFLIRGLYQFVKRLEENAQMAEARSTFEKFRPDAIKILGETYLDDEKSLRSRLDAVFRPIPSTFEEEIAARKLTGEKIKFVSKAKLRKAIIAKFKSAFGNQCVGSELLVNEPEPQFQMKVCGWILATNFSFGNEGTMGFFHTISSEDTFEHCGPHGTYNMYLIIGNNLSFCSVLGFGGAEWEYLVDDDVEPACDAAIKFCGHFFEVAPKLLKGLEFEKIAEGNTPSLTASQSG